MTIKLAGITINALDALTQADCDRALSKVQAMVPGLSFSCVFDEPDPKKYSYHLKIVTMPEGMDETTAYQWINSAFIETLEGPIDFTVYLP